jgi:hypothetical protein
VIMAGTCAKHVMLISNSICCAPFQTTSITQAFCDDARCAWTVRMRLLLQTLLIVLIKVPPSGCLATPDSWRMRRPVPLGPVLMVVWHVCRLSPGRCCSQIRQTVRHSDACARMHAAYSQWLYAHEGGVHTLHTLIAVQGVSCAVHALPHASAGAGGDHNSGMPVPHAYLSITMWHCPAHTSAYDSGP